MTQVANCRRYHETGGKFATDINDTGGKFSTSSPCVVDTGGKKWEQYQAQIPESELEGKSLYICFLYYPKVTKQNF